MSNPNPNYIATLFFVWMLLYWTVESFGWYIDKHKTEMEITPESINNTRKGRFWTYVIVGGILLILAIVSLVM